MCWRSSSPPPSRAASASRCAHSSERSSPCRKWTTTSVSPAWASTDRIVTRPCSMKAPSAAVATCTVTAPTIRCAPMKVVVTGAAGFIGSHLTEACLARGWDVVAIDSLTTYYSPTAKVRNAEHFRHHPRCELLEQDILDVDLSSLLLGTDVVFHLAAQAGVRA